MNRITHFFAKAAVRQSIQAQHARSGRMCATIFATSQNRPKIVSLDSYKNYLTQRQYSTHLQGKFVKVFQKLSETYDRVQQSQNELTKLETKWFLQAKKYSDTKQYDMEYQTMYMIISYFGQKKNILWDKVAKASLDNNYERVLTLLSSFRPDEIHSDLSVYYADALIHTAKSDEAFDFVTRVLDNPKKEMTNEYLQRLYYTKVQLLLERGRVEEAIDVCESHMDHDGSWRYYSMAMGSILTEALKDDGSFVKDALQVYDEAIEDFAEVHICMDRSLPHLLKGQLYERIGDVRAAIKEYEYVLWIKPTEKLAIELLIGLYSEVGQAEDVKIMQAKLANRSIGDVKFPSRVKKSKSGQRLK